MTGRYVPRFSVTDAEKEQLKTEILKNIAEAKPEIAPGEGRLKRGFGLAQKLITIHVSMPTDIVESSLREAAATKIIERLVTQARGNKRAVEAEDGGVGVVAYPLVLPRRVVNRMQRRARQAVTAKVA